MRGRSRGNLALHIAKRQSNTHHPQHAALHGRGALSGFLAHIHIQHFAPFSRYSVVDGALCRVYRVQHSRDGSVMLAALQGQKLRLYDTENWEVINELPTEMVNWTVTDTDLSDDGQLCVYSSISPTLHLCKPLQRQHQAEQHQALTLARQSEFGIMCVKFGASASEIWAGGNDHSVHLFSLQAQRVCASAVAHDDDVNSLAFLDNSCSVLATASDDCLIKLWDRRLFGSGTAVGVLVGHSEGVSHISPRADGLQLLSNSKDQTMKLWDVRRMTSACAVQPVPPKQHRWDYRWMSYPGVVPSAQQPDGSLRTFYGHKVLETLVRCYFSPMFTTGQRFVYTGSADGNAYVFDTISGELVSVLRGHQCAVRDLSWHPYLPQLVTSSFDGTLHEWTHNHNT